jgi:hypothetical protein
MSINKCNTCGQDIFVNDGVYVFEKQVKAFLGEVDLDEDFAKSKLYEIFTQLPNYNQNSEEDEQDKFLKEVIKYIKYELLDKGNG